MGVPKFFRWISERYPKINQPIDCPLNPETVERHFGKDIAVNNPSSSSNNKNDDESISKNSIIPDFDRLYLDMNGIIHCCSHNNATTEDGRQQTEEEMFRNIGYYLDRVISDIVKPNELVYMAIDGVAPRAKLNQQRSRRYRSGKTEEEIESTFHQAHQALQQKQKQEQNNYHDLYKEEEEEVFLHHPTKSEEVQEVEPGRFSGTFETTTVTTTEEEDNETSVLEEEGEAGNLFHSNVITPGTEFLDRCTAYIRHFIYYKLQTDPKWKDLTIILSGPNVPGEGEHKIMDFIRKQKHTPNYNPNTRHCLLGQDGDLIMLGLATHEPHFCLLREEVIFMPSRKRLRQEEQEKSIIQQSTGGTSTVAPSIDMYMHNTHFELLHMSTLRDYISYEFETSDVLPQSSFHLEPTIDDFVFLTFFVGNDFLPHMPALDIADEAFDLLFYTYKRNRYKFLSEKKSKNNANNNNNYPYLTKSGDIVSGKRLEQFLSDLGRHENPYYDNKKKKEIERNENIRSSDRKAGREESIPSVEALAAKEDMERVQYKKMLTSLATTDDNNKRNNFAPVVSSSMDFDTRKNKKNVFRPETDDTSQLEEGFFSKMTNILKFSISSTNNTRDSSIDEKSDGGHQYGEQDYNDIKGRYYWDKFKFTPVDKEKHVELRKAYLEGLVWNLQYYYKGCTSWDWYYPYHYGPMLSDLVNIENLLKDISFEGKLGRPLKPFEQLMGCLPPSSAYLLPKPYQWLMKSPSSPLKEFYPERFTVDMNGKRWPWEAVVLLPFIDSQRLIQTIQQHVPDNLLTEEQKERNVVLESADVYVYDKESNETITIPALNSASSFPVYDTLKDCPVRTIDYNDSQWYEKDITGAVFSPELLKGAQIPYPGFPTLKEAPVQGLKRWNAGINIFGMKSRYRTAILQMEESLPAIPPASVLGPKFIGTTVYFRYPFFQEGFVTAVSDSTMTIRGNGVVKKWSEEESRLWWLRKKSLEEQYSTGEGLTGTGGWSLPTSDILLSIRPLKGLQTLSDANKTKVKVYAKAEIEVPFVAALWSPSQPDPRFLNVPAKLEKDPFQFNQMNTGRTMKPIARLLGQKNVSASTTTTRKHQQFTPMKGYTSYTKAQNLGRTTRKYHHSTVHVKPHASSFGATARIASRQRSRFALPFVVATAATFISSGLVKNAHAQQTNFPSSRAMIAPWSSRQYSTTNPHIFDEYMKDDESPPPLEFAHGTTTLSFTFRGGIIVAVDSRASIGSFVGSKTTQKVLPVSRNILGTMAGGAADCSFWIRKLQAEAKVYELTNSKPITVARAAQLLSNALYSNRRIGLSVGTMIMGFDPKYGASIHYIDDTGVNIEGNMFAVGSGSTFALGLLDTQYRYDMSEEEAISLGIQAIRHATFRDAYSGGYVAVYVITADGWKKVFSEDLALTSVENDIPLNMEQSLDEEIN